MSVYNHLVASSTHRNDSVSPPGGSAAVREIDPTRTPRRQRYYLTLTELEKAKVDAFMADRGIRSFAGALVQLVNAGLRAKGV